MSSSAFEDIRGFSSRTCEGIGSSDPTPDWCCTKIYIVRMTLNGSYGLGCDYKVLSELTAERVWVVSPEGLPIVGNHNKTTYCIWGSQGYILNERLSQLLLCAKNLLQTIEHILFSILPLLRQKSLQLHVIRSIFLRQHLLQPLAHPSLQ
jgi:hypothetical protein